MHGSSEVIIGHQQHRHVIEVTTTQKPLQLQYKSLSATDLPSLGYVNFPFYNQLTYKPSNISTNFKTPTNLTNPANLHQPCSFIRGSFYETNKNFMHQKQYISTSWYPWEHPTVAPCSTPPKQQSHVPRKAPQGVVPDQVPGKTIEEKWRYAGMPIS